MNDVNTVRVDLGARSYPIHIGNEIISQAGKSIAPLVSTRRAFVVTDETVADLHLSALKASLADAQLTPFVIILPPGEATKNFDNLELVLDFLLEAEAERDDVLVAFGGGVIGDLTGLAAGMMKRGMKFVQIPTTLLAQVDSSVGGKTAINTSHGKNLVGMFYQPSMVLADLGILQTLPHRQKLAGYAEIIKYALIDDPDFYEYLDSNWQEVLEGGPALASAVQTSCEAKARIVSADETERGKRALLNLGHTFGHALEKANNYGPDLLHGEGVGAGMALAYRYSARLGLLDDAISETVSRHLDQTGLVTDLRKLGGGPYDAGHLTDYMMQDKKVKSGQVTLILTKGIGQAFIQSGVDLSDVKSFLEVETNT